MSKRFLLPLVSIFLMASGCSTLYPPVGNTLNSYSEDVAIADFLTYQDVDLLCEAGTGLVPLIDSFKNVESKTHKTMTTLYLLSGFCAEQEAHAMGVMELIHDNRGEYDLVKNYSALKKRAHAKAAMRQYQSYLNTITIYPVSKAGGCPEFAIDQDELIYMLGNLQGLEAILNDGDSGALANIPKSISNDIYRSLNCLDSAKWWGVPSAVQGALLAFLPNLDREKAMQADEMLLNAVHKGRQMGVPLAETVALAAWHGKGETKLMDSLLADHFEFQQSQTQDTKYFSIVYINHRHLANKADILKLEIGESITADPADAYSKTQEVDLGISLDDF